MEAQEWKSVNEFKSFQINDNGEVKSLSRIVNAKNNSQRLVNGRILKQSISNAGYCYVLLRKSPNSKPELKLIHRLVTEAFIPNPDNLPEVNHKNGIKTDNRVENLEWCTSSENQIHAIKNKLYENAKGENIAQSKLTEKEVLEIRAKYIPRKYSIRILAKEYNVTHCTILEIIHNKTWKHVN